MKTAKAHNDQITGRVEIKNTLAYKKLLANIMRIIDEYEEGKLEKRKKKRKNHKKKE